MNNEIARNHRNHLLSVVKKSTINALRINLLCHNIWHRHIWSHSVVNQKEVKILTIILSAIPSATMLGTYENGSVGVPTFMKIAMGEALLVTNAARASVQSPIKLMTVDIHMMIRAKE